MQMILFNGQPCNREKDNWVNFIKFQHLFFLSLTQLVAQPDARLLFLFFFRIDCSQVCGGPQLRANCCEQIGL